ncbi:MAG: hypothetical protein M1827_007467 [Pycnora praestabilis]|nr:MAG: hypothetical protein M1827_007467 [Pycnora praestabilis]
MATPYFAPPSNPPPLLTDSQVLAFAQQGHLPVQLSPLLTNLYNALSVDSATFFDQPLDTKIARYPAADRTELGYNSVEDEKEYLSLRCRTSVDPDPIETVAAEVWQATAAMLHRVLGDLARAMDITHEAWDPMLDGCLSMPPSAKESTPTLLRIFRYLPDSGTADKHTDTGLLTLCVGTGRGLQVLQTTGDDRNGQWLDAEGPTLLAGKALQVLSGNRVRAGVHRVVGNPAGRSSAVFPLRPSLRNKEIDLALFGGQGTLNVPEMWSKIKSSRYNVNAAKGVREEQKQSLMSKGEDGAAVSTPLRQGTSV